ncbi:unnamed protein product, partial [Adineta ricciae]
MFDSKSISIASFFRHTTLCEHAELLESVMETTTGEKLTSWTALHLNEGIASFAQERIFLDEKIRFATTSKHMYTVPVIYRVTVDIKPISILRLRKAIREVILKHSILRTALFTDTHGTVRQLVIDASRNELFGFDICHIKEDNSSISEMIRHSNLFNLTEGRLLHCHLLRQQSPSLQNHDHLSTNDIILFHI